MYFFSQKPPITTDADRAQSSKDKSDEEGSAPFYLPIVQSPELEYTYEDVEVGVPQEEDKYTALSSLTADKEDGSQYTTLIKIHVPSQSVQRTSQGLSDVPLDETQRCVQESGQKAEPSEEIEPYDYESFENSGSMSKSVNGGSVAAGLEQAGLCQSQDEIYY